MNASPEDILTTWFGPRGDAYPTPQPKLWWGKDPEVDAELGRRFGDALEEAASGALEAWLKSPGGWLAAVILLDQLSRNIHRDDAKMYALDDEAVDLVLRGLERGVDAELHPRERVFFYMPLMHAESVPLQRKCVRLFRTLAESTDDPEQRKTFEQNVDFAIRHQVIVERFGRFPHRNQILGRASTAEEVEFLKQPGSSF